MASTGTAVFTISADELVNSSLRGLRILQDGQGASGSMLTDGLESLNMIVKNAQADGLPLWTYMLLAIPCVTNKTTYTIGPVGADVTTVRPLRLMTEGNFIRQVVGGMNIDTPLNAISRTDYMNMGSKDSLGVVNSLYYHPGIDLASGATSPSVGYGTLKVYVSPSDATRTVYGNFQRPLYDINSGTDEFDFPADCFLYLKWTLMSDLADDYEVPEERINRVTNKAEYFRKRWQDASVEEAPFRIQPDARMGARW